MVTVGAASHPDPEPDPVAADAEEEATALPSSDGKGMREDDARVAEWGLSVVVEVRKMVLMEVAEVWVSVVVESESELESSGLEAEIEGEGGDVGEATSSVAREILDVPVIAAALEAPTIEEPTLDTPVIAAALEAAEAVEAPLTVAEAGTLEAAGGVAIPETVEIPVGWDPTAVLKR